MWRNSELPAEHFLTPSNVGDAAEPSFIGSSASLECGASLQISLHIDETSQRIKEAKFRAAGCSVLVAAASLLTDDVKGKTTAEAAATWQQSGLIENQLGPLPAGRNDCAALARDALVAAIRQYSDVVRVEWEGDEALICTCFGVSELTIEREIGVNKLRSVAEVTKACNAGAGCRSCWPLIEDILDEVNRES